VVGLNRKPLKTRQWRIKKNGGSQRQEGKGSGGLRKEFLGGNWTRKNQAQKPE